jgi:hypothetical protein
MNAREGKWFQKQAAEHREEICELRALIVRFADELAPGGLSGRLLADDLRSRLKHVKKT